MKTTEAEPHQTIRIWKKTLKTFRLIHALTGESLVSIFDRLGNAELERIQRKQTDENSESL